MRGVLRLCGAVGAGTLATVLFSGRGAGGGHGERADDASSAPERSGTDSGAVSREELQGDWIHPAADPREAMTLAFDGQEVRTIPVADGPACTGGMTGDTSFTLKCRRGGTDYGSGRAESLAGDILEVTWRSGRTTTFTKVVAPPSPPRTAAADTPVPDLSPG
ncbi:hypothetical protein [Streptomyces oceani]|uniref:Uncharacterized protein n=1 Tax=Streptomyces oceani TaxID=1075402 RepID=A0A1E7KHJ7_9ACTN|nr:hypothetical protein [Streptomyces oceani]OEV03314.1 hypothetical protein AN216_12270 [Streptomyces oceani]